MRGGVLAIAMGIDATGGATAGGSEGMTDRESLSCSLDQILVKKAVVNLWMTNLWSFQVKNSTTNLE